MLTRKEQEGTSENNGAVCPESTIESANMRNPVRKHAPVQSGDNKFVCESTIESANRRNFVKKAAIAAAAIGVGSTLLGSRLPTSSARSNSYVQSCVAIFERNVFAGYYLCGCTPLPSCCPVELAVNGYVVAASCTGAALHGRSYCPNGYGLLGCSPTTGTGVRGTSTCGTGVSGQAGIVGVEGVAGTATAIPIIAKGASGQTAPLQEWQKSCGKPLTVIDEFGNLGVAIGGAKPATTLQVDGGISLRVVTVTANYTMKVSDYAILANATSAALTVTLSHANTSGLMVHIKKIDSSAHAVTIAVASGDNIETLSTKTLSTRFSSLTLIADGVHTWYIQSNAT
jgi:hypothetical protein